MKTQTVPGRSNAFHYQTVINIHYQHSYLFSWQDEYPMVHIYGKLGKSLAWFMHCLRFCNKKQQEPKLANKVKANIIPAADIICLLGNWQPGTPTMVTTAGRGTSSFPIFMLFHSRERVPQKIKSSATFNFLPFLLIKLGMVIGSIWQEEPRNFWFLQ